MTPLGILGDWALKSVRRTVASVAIAGVLSRFTTNEAKATTPAAVETAPATIFQGFTKRVKKPPVGDLAVTSFPLLPSLPAAVSERSSAACIAGTLSVSETSGRKRYPRP